MHKGVHLRTALRIWWKAGHCCTLQATKWKSMSRNPKSVEKLGMTSKIPLVYMIYMITCIILYPIVILVTPHSTVTLNMVVGLKSIEKHKTSQNLALFWKVVAATSLCRFAIFKGGLWCWTLRARKQTQVFAVPRNRSISAFPAFSVLRNGKFWGIGVVFGVCCVLMCVNVCYELLVLFWYFNISTVH